MIEPDIHNLVLKIKVEKLQQFAIGQRWLSDTETELGLGVLIDVDERSVSILFPKAMKLASMLAVTHPYLVSYLMRMTNCKIRKVRSGLLSQLKTAMV